LTQKENKNGAQSRYLAGLESTKASILIMKAFISMFAKIRKVVVTYSKNCVEKEKTTNHVVKISKRLEGL
jgi:hypothetical protein